MRTKKQTTRKATNKGKRRTLALREARRAKYGTRAVYGYWMSPAEGSVN